MPAFIVNQRASVTCSHAGTATPTMPSSRVLIDGSPLITIASPYIIPNCTLRQSSGPFCTSGQFTAGATRVLSDGTPLALNTPGQSTCIATGMPMIVVQGQSRVSAK